MTTPGTVTFGELLRRYRTAATLSQEALAMRAGLSREAPRRATVALLAEALGLSSAERGALDAGPGAQPFPRQRMPPRSPRLIALCHLCPLRQRR